MTKRSVVVAAFSVGLVLGVVIGWAVASPKEPDRYRLTKDIDLENSYFFVPRSSAPVKGTIKAGSEFEVDWRYSNADYVVFRTVIDRQSLVAVSRPVATPPGSTSTARPTGSTTTPDGGTPTIP
jgi:hypothetical protein